MEYKQSPSNKSIKSLVQATLCNDGVRCDTKAIGHSDEGAVVMMDQGISPFEILHDKYGDVLPTFDCTFIEHFVVFMEEKMKRNEIDDVFCLLIDLVINNSNFLVRNGIFNVLHNAHYNHSIYIVPKIIKYSEKEGAISFLNEYGLFNVALFLVNNKEETVVVAEILLELAKKVDDMSFYLMDYMLFPVGNISFDMIDEIPEINFLDVVDIIMCSNNLKAVKIFLKAIRAIFKRSKVMCNLYGYHFMNNIDIINSGELSVSYAKTISVLLDEIDIYKVEKIFCFIYKFLNYNNEDVVISGIKLINKLSEKEKMFSDDSIILKMESKKIIEKIVDLIENGAFKIKEYGYWSIFNICLKYPQNLFEQFIDKYKLFDLVLEFFINDIVYASDDLILPISKITLIILNKIYNNEYFMNKEHLQLIEQSLQSINTLLDISTDKDNYDNLITILEMLELLYNRFYLK